MQIHKTGTKTFYSYKGLKYINDWIDKFKNNEKPIGFLTATTNDFQHQKRIFIANAPAKSQININIIASTLLPCAIYLAVRHVIPADWLNDRDQFLYPNALWENDKLFHSDCLAYSLFHGSNNIQSGFGINHWIPFSEEEVGASGLFKSHFMVDFIAGKFTPSFPRRRESPNMNDTLKEPTIMSHIAGDSRLRGNSRGLPSANPPFADLLHRESTNNKPKPLEFSVQATDLFTCGKKLWQYYHQEARNDENYLNDASFYDIRRYFQGSRGLSSANPLLADLSHRAKTRMNNKSSDAEYNELISELRKALKKLGEERIVEKVFEYGFLLR